jgi:ABC-2 type transport system ATP-binding protein
MVLVDDVHKSYGSVKAVQGISFELKAGQIAGLLGPNGAGKSTTIRMMAGYIAPDAGRVVIAGCDTTDHAIAARFRIGYLSEHNPLYQEMKVSDYLHFRGKLFGMPRPVRKAAVDFVLNRCWLKAVRNRRISNLSKGFKQRVGLASALLHNPPVLILDEPTNGLDPTQIRETRQLIKELSTDRTMLLSSHILPEVEKLCDRVIVVSRGRVRADGTPSQLVRNSGDAASFIVQARGGRPGDDEKLVRVWSNLPYVLSVRRTNPDKKNEITEWTHWIIAAKHGAPDLREPIAMSAMQNGILIRELRTETITLEHVFMRLIEEAEEPAVAPPPPPGPPENVNPLKQPEKATEGATA